MSDIVLVILTSEGCGHCAQLRGNGVLGNGTPFHTYSFLESHIDPLKRKDNITMINIHFSSMNGHHAHIQTVSKFTKVGNNVHQERYYSENDKTFVNVLAVNEKDKVKVLKQKQQVLVDSKEIEWMQFLDLKVPKNIERYSFYYPCFLVFQKEDWKSGGNILGIPNAGFVVKDKDGNFGLEKSGQGLQQRNFPPQKLLTDALNGELRFKPMKNFYVEKVEEVKKVEEVSEKEIKIEEIPENEVKVEEKKVKPENKEVRIKNDSRTFIIKNYHDE